MLIVMHHNAIKKQIHAVTSIIERMGLVSVNGVTH